jgi:hypothetical protein
MDIYLSLDGCKLNQHDNESPYENHYDRNATKNVGGVNKEGKLNLDGAYEDGEMKIKTI